MPQTILVTGAAGFIGQDLVRRLAASPGYSIKALVRRPLADDVEGGGSLEPIIGDLLEPDTYRVALEGCHAVVHLAAVTGRATPSLYEQVNVEGTRLLLEACKAAGVQRFVLVSTIAAGYPDQRYYPYARTKARAEKLVRASGLEFAIVRPTVVLGKASPIWQTLRKIGGLPVVPLPEGSQSVTVQPIHADDVVRGLVLLVESGRFDGAVLELGGPRPLPFRELLEITQREVRGEDARVVRVPFLGAIRFLLATVEPVLRPLMPVTAGQLSLFANDSAVSENWLQAQLRAGMPTTEATIADLVRAEGTIDSGPAASSHEKRQARPMSEDDRALLREECRGFSGYLVGTNPSDYIEDQYARACHVHGLAFDEAFTTFDRVTLRLARCGRVLARWADAYCAILHRNGALRRKLIVLAAILEHVAPMSEVFDRVPPRHAFATVLSLAVHGLASGISLVLGAAILLPASILCWVSTRSAGPGARAGSVA